MISRTLLRLQVSQPRIAIQRDGQDGSEQNWNGPGLIGEASPNEGATSVAVVSNTLMRNGVPSIWAEQPSQRVALFSAMMVRMRMPFTSMVPLIVPEPAAPWRRARVMLLVATLIAAACGPAGDPTDPAAEVQGDGELQELLIRHDSRDPAYRLTSGAVEVGTEVVLQVRTGSDDAVSVMLSVAAPFGGSATKSPALRVARGVPCADVNESNRGASAELSTLIAPDPVLDPTNGLTDARCDVWRATIDVGNEPTAIGYHFVIADGSAAVKLADDNVNDQGLGSISPANVGGDWAIVVSPKGFAASPLLSGSVVYQIFPDRFGNANPLNDGGAQPRYKGVASITPWNTLPAMPPKGEDFYGGDLDGIRLRLPHLVSIGVNTIYLNPIFDANSNHRYDGNDYLTVDPRLGGNAALQRLLTAAQKLNITVILDGVFNHVSSDSPIFDRYGRWPTVGACESVDSPYRDWFIWTKAAGAKGPCAGASGPNTAGYVAWANYDTLPVLNKNNDAVRALILGDASGAPAAALAASPAGDAGVARWWLQQGVAGWRLDVMPDGSFPEGFWQEFRIALKAASPNAPIIGELWNRRDALRLLRGDAADATMNYRFRDAVLAYLGGKPEAGATDSTNRSAVLFIRKLMGIAEDYPTAVTLANLTLLDSHDTSRSLWEFTPGDGRDGKELPNNLSIGKARQLLAATMQYLLPGSPTIYYGDEIGVSGATDPDDRRTFPILPTDPRTARLDGSGAGGRRPAPLPAARAADLAMLSWYQTLATIRAAHPQVRSACVDWLAVGASGAASRTLLFARRANGVVGEIAQLDAPSSWSVGDLLVAVNADGGAERLIFNLGADIHLREVARSSGESGGGDPTTGVEVPARTAIIWEVVP
jgi:glycosidase